MGRYSGRPDGVVFYRGPSRIDGVNIIGVATFKTANDKTGNLIQTWILVEDTHPVEAINNGKDKSVCGDCPLRGILELQAKSSYKSKRSKAGSTKHVNRKRGCYVAIQNAPRAIWESYHNGNYPDLDTKEHARWFRGRGIRYGSYGEPVAIPIRYWDRMRKLANGRSFPGYTHQWRDRRFAAWSKYLMASTHSPAENELAKSKGWRTFRTSMDGDDLLDNEILCPASEEGGYTETCESCGACNGCASGNTDRTSIVIVAHGGDSRITGITNVIAAAS